MTNPHGVRFVHCQCSLPGMTGQPVLVQALRAHPNGPPEIRLGLAQCLFRLGKFKLAEAAFRRTLDCSPGCGPALLGLAITSFYKSSDK